MNSYSYVVCVDSVEDNDTVQHWWHSGPEIVLKIEQGILLALYTLVGCAGHDA